MTQDLLFDITGSTGWVTFNRPDQRNALTFAMYEGLAEICSKSPTDGSGKAISSRGAGGGNSSVNRVAVDVLRAAITASAAAFASPIEVKSNAVGGSP